MSALSRLFTTILEVWDGARLYRCSACKRRFWAMSEGEAQRAISRHGVLEHDALVGPPAEEDF